MTNHWVDYRNSDVFMNIGGNTAENHPVSMKWIEHARKHRGAKLMVVDPRITRTAAVADLHVPIRPGTNIAYLGGMINYILQNGLYQEEYVTSYTNATFLINEEFSFDEQEGLFSGVQDDPARDAKKYDTSSWQYQRDGEGNILKDPTMQDPNCVMQLMKKIYSKYTLDSISKITGCPKETLEESYALYASTGKPEKAGNLMYAMGITQFTHGSQNVRATAVVQTLLGNMGIPGGGVNAQRGQSNVQGATDQANLFHIMPGYLAAPKAAVHPTLDVYIEKETPATSWWANKPKYLVSLLKEFWGDNATPQNDFRYDYYPKLDARDHSHIAMYKYMGEGEVEGMICWADNPAVTGPTAGAKRSYQSELKWLVSVDIFENETAAFWKSPELNAAEIKTEVFMLPATASGERDGTKANSGRWIQWQWKAQDPPGEAKSDLQIAYDLLRKLKEVYADGSGALPGPITEMLWDYGMDGNEDEVDVVKVAKALNGYTVADGKFVTNFVGLQDDGSTACGDWLYAGYYNNYEKPACQSRIRETEGIGSHLGWSFAWPLNRRIVYNRCSADQDGNPWNPELQMFWWDDEGKLTKQYDINDWPGSWSYDYVKEFAYIMLPEGHARLFAVAGVNDGPVPVHYEPAESLVPNSLYPKATFNPITQRFYKDHVVETDEERARYPYILSTYRVTEHYQSGIMTRNMPWLNELMPELFIEIDEDLAAKLNIKNGDFVEIESKRLFKNGKQGSIDAKACVTKRLKPFEVHGETRHVVGMPFHWGFAGMSTGHITNDLCPSIGCANTNIPESKASLCNIRKKGV